MRGCCDAGWTGSDRAFSSEVGPGSRKENASKQKADAFNETPKNRDKEKRPRIDPRACFWVT
jgi:hypothetical protein